jgi:hypothetical protein
MGHKDVLTALFLLAQKNAKDTKMTMALHKIFVRRFKKCYKIPNTGRALGIAIF